MPIDSVHVIAGDSQVRWGGNGGQLWHRAATGHCVLQDSRPTTIRGTLSTPLTDWRSSITIMPQNCSSHNHMVGQDNIMVRTSYETNPQEHGLHDCVEY